MKKWFLLLSLMSALLLIGCSTSSKPKGAVAEAQAPQGGDNGVPVVRKANADNVIAEGVVEPARSSYLAFEMPGTVVEILVESGTLVEAGEPLVRLDTRELALALDSAEQDVLAQEAAVQQLLNGASDKVIARADKGNADQIAQAEVALQVKQLQLEQARAEDPSIGVTAAQTRIKQLELKIAQTRAQDPTPSVTAAEVALQRAQIALADTQDEYNKALDRPWEDQDIRDAWAKRLEQAQLDHKAAQAQLDNALNTRQAHAVGLSILATQVEEAKTQLAQAIVAQEAYSSTLKILAADIEAARLQLEALKTWDNPYRDEASDEEVARARAMLEKTRIAVEQLKVQMEDAELTAPFAGTVVDIEVEIGDHVNPSQVVIILATLDALEIHTTDLTELDVGQVALGQPVKITVDALPEHEFSGVVAEIALQGQNYRGDIVYEVTVTLDKPEEVAVLRWGMTTMVEIVTR
jgi:HlyD family secretion protein